MATLLEELIADSASGKYRRRFRQYCLDWKENLDPIALAHVLKHAVEDGRAEDLYTTLLDEDFRTGRQLAFGVNTLRADLQAGRRFFSATQPGLLRYIQVTLLEQTAADDVEIVRTHRRHCQEYGDFLQLDRFPAERSNMGLERVLNRVFPLTFDARIPWTWGSGERTVTLRLLGYEVGDWSCRCGRTVGFPKRYEAVCPCGETRGSGRITPDTESCPKCDSMPVYSTCPGCGTRVTLNILWQAREAAGHPALFRVPLNIELAVELDGASAENKSFTLMHLPVPLGLREQGGHLVFDLPDMLWLGERSWDDSAGNLLSLGDAPRYDRQTEICKILEAVFRRTLLGNRGSYLRFGRTLTEAICRGPKHGFDFTYHAERYTRGFERRLSTNAGSPDGDSDLLRFLELPVDVAVATSAALRDRAVIVNRRLVDLQVLSAPRLLDVEAILDQGDVITCIPPGAAHERISGLDEWGVVPVGARVEPGQVLVGKARQRTEDELSAEERLLRAIFGEKADLTRDTSLVMNGKRAGHVVAEHLWLDMERAAEIPTSPGRLVEHTDSWRAQVRITVAVDQPVEIGDLLDGEEAATGVVCGIAGGRSLQKMADAAAEPDLLVAPDHPWAPPGEGGQLRTVRVRLNHRTLVGQAATSHAIGRYSLISQQPVNEGFHRPQTLGGDDFRWLMAHGAHHLAFELYGPRSDCVEMRVALYESLLKRDQADGPLPRLDPAEWSSPHDSPSHAARRLDRLLRSALIRPVLSGDSLVIEQMTDDDVLADSRGVVTQESTYDGRTLRPQEHGLFCESVFGPVRDRQCSCGKYRGAKSEGIVCERCGVEVTRASVRRERFGRIELPVPVVHPWYLDGVALARLAALLHLSEQELLGIARCEIGFVPSPGKGSLSAGEIVAVGERPLGARFVTGGEAVELLLGSAAAPEPEKTAVGGIVIRRLPVLPPDLRPYIHRSGGRVFTADLNELYLAVVWSARQLARLVDLGVPPGVFLDERRLLQKHVERLLLNDRAKDPARDRGGRRLVCVAEAIARTHEDFEHRSIDYSAYTSLVAGHTPEIDTALLPSQFAWDLFRPLIMRELVERGVAQDLRTARRMIEERAPEAIPALRDVGRQSMVLVSLNSQSHRLLALRVEPSDGLALQVHPALLDQVGWRHLGEYVKIFAVMTPETLHEAEGFLTSSRRRTSADPANTDSVLSSVLSRDGMMTSPGALALAALEHRSVPLTAGDDLLLQRRFEHWF